MNWAKTCAKYPEANFYQSPNWAKVNELIGDKTITKDLMNDGLVLAIVRKAKRGRYLEIPCGPIIDWKNRNHQDRQRKPLRFCASPPTTPRHP